MRMRGSDARTFRCDAGGAVTVVGAPAGAGTDAGTGILGAGAREDFPPQARAAEARTTSPRLIIGFESVRKGDGETGGDGEMKKP
jgi:hypothetical protein